MLFEFKNSNDDFYDMNLDYFNLNKLDNNDMKNTGMSKYTSKDGKIDLQDGFYLGNIFVDTYKPYKNFKPKKVNAYSEEQKMLLRIQELDFILNDLNLYLDVNPNDKNIYDIFKKTALELESLKKKYEDKYRVLKIIDDTKGKYTWIDNPWPWDGGLYV